MEENAPTTDFDFKFVDQKNYDFASIDLVLMDKEKDIYNVMLRYLTVDPNTKKVSKAIRVQTGILREGKINVAESINSLLVSGFFTQDVSNFGSVYDIHMKEIESINWNQLFLLTQIETTQKLH